MTTWQHGDRTFIYRVAAVIVDNNRVLLHPTPSGEYWSLLQGDVNFLEDSTEALRRIIREQAGVEVVVERLLWVVESFFLRQERQYHVLGLYFLTSLPASESTDPSNTGAGWFTREASQLDVLPLDPPFLHDGLLHLTDQTVYLTNTQFIDHGIP